MALNLGDSNQKKGSSDSSFEGSSKEGAPTASDNPKSSDRTGSSEGDPLKGNSSEDNLSGDEPPGDAEGGNIFTAGVDDLQEGPDHKPDEEKPSISGTERDLSSFEDHPGSIGDPTEGAQGDQTGAEKEAQREQGSSGPDASDEPELSNEGYIESSEELLQFVSTYRFTRQDVGFTPEEVFHRQEDEENEPDEFEEEILDAILFEGVYVREFTIGSKGSFKLATHGPETTRNCMSVLREEESEDDSAMQGLINTMMVARNLSEYMGRQTCDPSPGENDFQSREAVKSRFEFCRNLPQSVLDAIGSRVNMFIERTDRAMMRNLSNF